MWTVCLLYFSRSGRLGPLSSFCDLAPFLTLGFIIFLYLSNIITALLNIPPRIWLRTATTHCYETHTTWLKDGKRCFLQVGPQYCQAPVETFLFKLAFTAE